MTDYETCLGLGRTGGSRLNHAFVPGIAGMHTDALGAIDRKVPDTHRSTGELHTRLASDPRGRVVLCATEANDSMPTCSIALSKAGTRGLWAPSTY